MGAQGHWRMEDLRQIDISSGAGAADDELGNLMDNLFIIYIQIWKAFLLLFTIIIREMHSYSFLEFSFFSFRLFAWLLDRLFLVFLLVLLS